MDKEYNNKTEYIFDLMDNDFWDSYIYSSHGLIYTYTHVLSKQERLITDMYISTQFRIDNKEWTNDFRDQYIAKILCINLSTLRASKSSIKKFFKQGYKARVDDQVKRYAFIRTLKNKLKSIFLGLSLVLLISPNLFATIDPADHLARFEREGKMVEAETKRRHELRKLEKETEVLARMERLGANNIYVSSSSSSNQNNKLKISSSSS